MPLWKELKEKLKADLDEVGKGLTLVSMRAHKLPDGSYLLTDKDARLVEKLFGVFKRLRWKLSFDLSKELEVDQETPILRKRALGGAKCGDPVKVRSCRKEHGDKTYLGVLIGDMATTVGHKCVAGVVTAYPAAHNPAIFVPELGDIIYGYESFWSRIDSEEDLQLMLTDDTIKNVWYMKALASLGSRREGVNSDE